MVPASRMERRSIVAIVEGRTRWVRGGGGNGQIVVSDLTYTVLQVLVSAVQFRPVSPSAPPRPWRQVSLAKPWRSSSPTLLGSTQYVACIGSMLSVSYKEGGVGGGMVFGIPCTVQGLYVPTGSPDPAHMIWLT